MANMGSSRIGPEELYVANLTAESVGGVKYYVLAHGATELTPLETVRKDLEQYKRIHG